MEYTYALTEQQKMDFARDGVIGPFDSFMPEHELDEIRQFFEELETTKKEHPLYGRFSVRDWHLVLPAVRRMFTHNAVVGRLIGLAGEDLVLWRSKVFYKAPGEGELGWHQEWGWFNGEEIGSDKPSLVPALDRGHTNFWNLTVWFALDTITLDNGPVQFVRGSQSTRYPIAMVPMTESAFFHDPFVTHSDPDEIVAMTKASKLILDIDTSKIFDGVDHTKMSKDEFKRFLYARLAEFKAAVTVPFEAKQGSIATMLMNKGQFVIFTERTMHGSLPNRTDKSRIAINCRVTTTDTAIYPARLHGDTVDGSNIDITNHRCVLLSGKNHNVANVYL